MKKRVKLNNQKRKSYLIYFNTKQSDQIIVSVPCKMARHVVSDTI